MDKLLWIYVIFLGLVSGSLADNITCTDDDIVQNFGTVEVLKKYQFQQNSKSKCKWTFQSNPSKDLLISIKDTTFSPQSNVCRNQYDLYDGDFSDPSAKSLANKRCEDFSLDIAESGILSMDLFNDFDNLGLTFDLRIIAGEDYSGTTCVVLSSLASALTEQYLSSPGFPETYKELTKCTWTITASESRVFVTILFLDLDETGGACKDTLKFTTGAGTAFFTRNFAIKITRSRGSTFCGKSTYPENDSAFEIRSDDTTLTVEFETDNIENLHGFLLKYRSFANCGEPDLITNADVDTSNGLLENATAEYECQLPFVNSNGNKIITCQMDETWTTTDLVCLATCKDADPLILDGASINVTGYIEGDTATYACNPDRIGVPTDLEDVSCLPDGTWVEPSIECRKGCLGDPDDLEGGSFMINGRFVDDTATYTCKRDRVQVGVGNDVTCLGDGTWEAINIMCEVICVDDPESIQDTSFRLSGRSIGDIATYTCNGNLENFGGVSVVKCEDNGQWQTPTIVCIDNHATLAAAGTMSIIIYIYFILIILVQKRRQYTYYIITYPI